LRKQGTGRLFFRGDHSGSGASSDAVLGTLQLDPFSHRPNALSRFNRGLLAYFAVPLPKAVVTASLNAWIP